MCIRDSPTISCPEDLTLECGDPANALLVIDWLSSAQSEDLCGVVTTVSDFAGTLPENCGGEVEVVFMGVDECMNEAECIATIIMEDTQLPDFINCPDDMTINVDVDLCGSNPIFSDPLPMDNCGVTAVQTCLLYTSPSPRDATLSRMPSSA